MSYQIVRTIKIDKDKVFINSACNNVSPKTYEKIEYSYFSKILKEQGKEAVEIALLKEYESGNLQGGKNKFTRALKVLRYIYQKEYLKFDWRYHNSKWGSEGQKKERELRESKEFNELLRKALNTKLSKTKYVISKKTYNNEIVYMKKIRNKGRWEYDIGMASKYDFKAEAEEVKSCFPCNEDWIIKELEK